MSMTNRLAFAVIMMSVLLFQPQTCHALSKSMTVPIYCRVEPALQFSSSDALTQNLVVSGNIGKQFISQSDLLTVAGQSVRMLSVTAL